MLGRRLPPGPKGHFLTGNLPELRRGQLAFYTRCAREFGDICTIRIGPRRLFLLFHPDLVEQVLTSRGFHKHFGLRMNRFLLGNGLLTSEGDFWLRQRRLIQPLFLREAIAGHGADMVALAEKKAAGWQDGEVRDLYVEMRDLSMVVIARVLFGADVSGKTSVVVEALAEAMERFPSRFLTLLPLPMSLPTPGNLRARRAVRKLDEVLYGLIAQRRAGGERRDLLSVLLRARHEDGEHMTDRQLRDEAMTLFLAGHDTTALTLTWAFYALAHHPEVLDELTSELRQVLGGRSPTVADLPQLRYTEQVIQEVMRVYPAVYAFGRQAVESCTLGGYTLAAGATVIMSQWVIHRDPRWYSDPERFDPSRWGDGLARRLPRYAYFPFGGGPRICIGNTFAMMESMLLLATLVQRFRVSPTPGLAIHPEPRFTLRPSGPVLLRLQKQRSKEEAGKSLGDAGQSLPSHDGQPRTS
jgi:cytochrome P450